MADQEISPREQLRQATSEKYVAGFETQMREQYVKPSPGQYEAELSELKDLAERRGMDTREYVRWEANQQLKPVAQMSNKELVSETRELHSQFKVLEERYREAPATQRAEIREEMQPIVSREKELRQEYQGRPTQEIARDRVPEPVGYGINR